MPHTCFVPLCKTRSSKTYTGGRSLFKPPAHLLEVWASNIPRNDRRLTSKDKVCEVHFESHYIEREFRHNVNGQEVTIKRSRPTLTKDAIPTLFPNCPSTHLSTATQLPKPLRLLDKPQRATSEKATNTPPLEETQENSHTNNNNHMTLWQLITTFTLPNAWGRYVDEDLDTADLFHFDRNHASSNRSSSICVQWKRDDFVPRVFVRGQEISQKVYRYFTPNQAGLLNFLLRLQSLRLCRGLDVASYPNGFPQKSVRTIGDRFYNKNCKGIHVEVCARCKYTEMFLARREDRLKAKSESFGRSATRTIQRYAFREFQLKKKIKACLHDNSVRKEIVLENAIRTLPAKQQEVVRHCFKRSGRQGLKYTRTWLMECLMMYVKSPGLYKYIRKHDILTVPTVRTLKTFMKTPDPPSYATEEVAPLEVETMETVQTPLEHLEDLETQCIEDVY